VTRRTNDFYETPPWMTRALLHHVPEIAGTILEPCAGDLSIEAVLSSESMASLNSPGAQSVTLITNDIDPNRVAEFHLDAADPELYRQIAHRYGGVDWVITNPPYQMPLCTNIVSLAVRHARVGVAMMLRISFKEPTAKVNPRGPWLEAHPITRELVMPRHSFTGNGKSDSCTTAWMIWSKVRLAGSPHVACYRANERFRDAGARVA
jgi:hypothetical protein